MFVSYFSLYQDLSFVLLCITIPQNEKDVNGAGKTGQKQS